MASKTLTVEDLRKQTENESIWVLNQTIDTKDKANIVFSVQHDGAATNVVVLATWIPINLTEIAPRRSIINSTAFLKALRLNTIKLITSEEATHLLSLKGAKEEQERVNKANINQVANEADIGKSVGDVAEIQSLEEIAAATNISASVISLCEVMDTGTGIEALNSVRNLGKLTKEEYLHILKKARSLGDEFTDLVDFCKEKLEALKEAAKRAA
jgi:hypothetical protein